MTKDIYQKIAEQYQQKTGKELDEDVFADKMADILIRLEEGTVDLENKLSTADVELINELTSDRVYVHYLFGKAHESGGFWECGRVGDVSRYPYLYFDGGLSFKGHEEAQKIAEDFQRKHNPIHPKSFFYYADVWDFSEGHKDFEARIFGFDLLSGDYMFQMWYSDTTNTRDKLGPTTYTLMLPEEKKAEIVPRIRKNPELLINVFSDVFGNFDNSKGTLKIDPKFKPRIEKAP